MCIYVGIDVLLVCAFSKFLLESSDDDFLHPLVGLGHEVDGGALRHDPDFAFAGFPDLLNNMSIDTSFRSPV